MKAEIFKAFILSALLYFIISTCTLMAILFSKFNNEAGILIMAFFIVLIILLTAIMSIINTLFFYIIYKNRKERNKREITALLFGLLYTVFFLLSAMINPGHKPAVTDFVTYSIIMFVHVITFFYAIRPEQYTVE